MKTEYEKFLQSKIKIEKEQGHEMHLCPLQFDIVDRCIKQFTNKGETVLEPFGGIMTVPYRAMKFKRKGIAFELRACQIYRKCKNE